MERKHYIKLKESWVCFGQVEEINKTKKKEIPQNYGNYELLVRRGLKLKMKL